MTTRAAFAWRCASVSLAARLLALGVLAGATATAATGGITESPPARAQPPSQPGHAAPPGATHAAPPGTAQGHGTPPPGPAQGHGAATALRPSPAPSDGRGQVLDMRHYHGRYYPPVGTVMPALPPDYRPYYRAGHRYYLAGGTWYAPRAGGFCVIAPPVGLVIAVLPVYYTTVWASGVPYYYANNVYYTQQPDQNGYAVVDPPDSIDPNSPPPDGGDGQSQVPQTAGSEDFIIYPKNGQSRDQQAADEYECNNWARAQTGFDPAQPGGGVPDGEADARHGYYDRALSACLLGRGYQLN